MASRKRKRRARAHGKRRARASAKLAHGKRRARASAKLAHGKRRARASAKRRTRKRKAHRRLSSGAIILRSVYGRRRKVRHKHSKFGGTFHTAARGRKISSDDLAGMLRAVPTRRLGRKSITIRARTAAGEWVTIATKARPDIALGAAARTLEKFYEEEEFVQVEIFESGR